MSGHRTRAERRVDELVAEKRRLVALHAPTGAEKARLMEISLVELPKAWRAVHQQRVYR